MLNFPKNFRPNSKSEAATVTGILAAIPLFIIIWINQWYISPYIIWGFLVFIPAWGFQHYQNRNLWVKFQYYPVFLSLGLVTAFAMGLSGSWYVAYPQYSNIGGLIPWSDASGYYAGGLELSEWGTLDDWASRRPLISGFYGTLFKLSGMNLTLSLGITTLLVAMAGVLTCREITKTHGTLSGALLVFFLLAFYLPLSSATMPELPGMLFGLLAFGLIWRGWHRQNQWFFYGGLFFLSLAMNYRPGALFVLPAIALAGGWRFSGNKKFSFLAVANSFFAILLPFGITLAYQLGIAQNHAPPFGNFAHTLYGLAAGGKGWAYVVNQHPEWFQASDAESNKHIYKEALILILANPWNLIKGYIFSFFQYVPLYFIRNYPVFSFEILDKWIFRGLLLAIAIGIVPMMKSSGKTLILWLWVGVGVFFSVPFIIDGQPRVSAPMLGFEGAFATLSLLSVPSALFFILQKLRPQTGLFFKTFFSSDPQKNKSPIGSSWSDGLLPVYSTILILLFSFAPFIIAYQAKGQKLPPPVCPAGQIPVVFRAFPGSEIQLTKQKTKGWTESGGLFVQDSNFISPSNEQKESFNHLHAPQSLRLILNLADGAISYLVFPEGVPEHHGELLKTCGTPVSDQTQNILMASAPTRYKKG